MRKSKSDLILYWTIRLRMIYWVKLWQSKENFTREVKSSTVNMQGLEYLYNICFIQFLVFWGKVPLYGLGQSGYPPGTRLVPRIRGNPPEYWTYRPAPSHSATCETFPWTQSTGRSESSKLRRSLTGNSTTRQWSVPVTDVSPYVLVLTWASTFIAESRLFADSFSFPAPTT